MTTCDELTRPSPYLSTQQAAEHLNLKPQTLTRWRHEGKGPIYRAFGGRIRYTRNDLETWADGQIRQSTSQT